MRKRSPLVRKKRRTNASGSRSFLFFLVSVTLVVLYLWGRVQIDFVIRENDRLGREVQQLQNAVDDLRVDVNAKKGYQRIVTLAREQGMVFVSASRIEELEVDLRGIHPLPEAMPAEVQFAVGSAAFRLSRSPVSSESSFE